MSNIIHVTECYILRYLLYVPRLARLESNVKYYIYISQNLFLTTAKLTLCFKVNIFIVISFVPLGEDWGNLKYI